MSNHNNPKKYRQFDKRQVAKIMKQKQPAKRRTGLLAYLQQTGARVLDEISIMAVNRGFQILIHFATIYGVGQIVRIVVDKNLTVGQVIQLLKDFYRENKELGINLVKLINKTLLNAGECLKDIVEDGFIALKVITTNAF